MFAGEKNPEFSAGSRDGGHTLTMVHCALAVRWRVSFLFPGPSLDSFGKDIRRQQRQRGFRSRTLKPARLDLNPSFIKS